jgi:hypothetical protein
MLLLLLMLLPGSTAGAFILLAIIFYISKARFRFSFGTNLFLNALLLFCALPFYTLSGRGERCGVSTIGNI